MISSSVMQREKIASTGFRNALRERRGPLWLSRGRGLLETWRGAEASAHLHKLREMSRPCRSLPTVSSFQMS